MKALEILDGILVWYTVLSYQNESSPLLASILPQAIKEGESKEGSSHFDEKLSF